MDKERDALSPPEEWAFPPEEFPALAAEAVPPPEEASSGRDLPRPEKRRRRKLLYALAAGALLLLLAGRLPKPLLPPEPPAEELPAAAPELSPAPTPEPAPEPSPAPTPEPTPEPSPVPEPECSILFYHFSSSNYVRLVFTRPEAFSSVELSLSEPILDLPAASYTLTPEDYADGELDLPGIDTTQLYLDHMQEYEEKNAWPEELKLHAVIHCDKGEGEIVEERDMISSPEQGWSVRYWPRDTEKSDWTFPGCFVFSTYESETPIALVLDDPEAVKSGTLSVAFFIDGRAVDSADVEYLTWQEAYTIGDTPISEPFYFARFVFPRPAWAPESGVVRVRVVQYLDGYDQTIVIEREQSYTEQGG